MIFDVRIWDLLAKSWIPLDDAIYSFGDETIEWNWRNGRFTEIRRKNEYLIQEYTGVKDKNGRKIYNQDKLEYEFLANAKMTLLVDKWDGKFIAYNPDSNWELMSFLKDDKSGYSRLMIVGNLLEDLKA